MERIVHHTNTKRKRRRYTFHDSCESLPVKTFYIYNIQKMRWVRPAARCLRSSILLKKGVKGASLGGQSVGSLSLTLCFPFSILWCVKSRKIVTCPVRYHQHSALRVQFAHLSFGTCFYLVAKYSHGVGSRSLRVKGLLLCIFFYGCRLASR